MILGVFTAGQDELARLHTSYETDRMRSISMAIFAEGRAFSGHAFVYTSVHPFGYSQQF